MHNKFAKGGAVLAAALSFWSSIAAAEEEPLILQPSSKWHLDFADDSCRLARQFGEGREKTMFFIERYEPGDPFFLLVAGKQFDFRDRRSETARFGPGGYERSGPIVAGELGEFKPAMMLSNMRLLPDPNEQTGEGESDEFDAEAIASDTDVLGQQVTPEQERGISWFEIDRGGRKAVRLMLGEMGEPMVAMRGCTDELLTHWGIDVDAHRGLTRAVAPKSDYTRWVRSNDYPRNLMQRGAQGLVQFRLSVGPDGKPTQCHVQRSSRPEGFDTAVCEALMRRAEFEPALDASGQPIASYWRNGVYFRMP